MEVEGLPLVAVDLRGHFQQLEVISQRQMVLSLDPCLQWEETARESGVSLWVCPAARQGLAKGGLSKAMEAAGMGHPCNGPVESSE